MYASVNWVSISSGNGLAPNRRQAIALTNADLLSIALMGTNFSKIRMGILSFSFRKMHLKLSFAIMAAILFKGRWVNISSAGPVSMAHILGNHCACRCLGTLQHQTINSHNTDYKVRHIFCYISLAISASVFFSPDDMIEHGQWDIAKSHATSRVESCNILWGL